MLQDQIRQLIEEHFTGSDKFIVEIKVSKSRIAIFIDSESGIRIEDCIELNRFLQQQFETTEVLEHHELEVSSPGMDMPLRVLQQYRKRLGKEVSVLTSDGVKHQGILRSASDEGILLEETVTVKHNNKKEKLKKEVKFAFPEIKETKVIFQF